MLSLRVLSCESDSTPMAANSNSMFQFEIPFAIENKAYIYALVDPRTREIRYVGKAADPQRRLSGHMRDSVLRRYNDKRTCWLKSLKALGIVPSIVILECVPESDWRACEIKWIAHFRSTGTNLTNTQDGGEGQTKGWHPSPESIEKTASKLRGKKRPPEIVKKISALLKGRKISPEHAAVRRAGLKNWWANMTPEQKAAKMEKLWKPGMETMAKANTSGQMGVSWCKDRQKWDARINVNGKPVPLGRYDTFEEAVAVRNAAQKKKLSPA